MTVKIAQAHVLEDVLQFGLRVVFCGTAAGQRSGIVGAYYAGRGNSFWKTIHALGLTSERLAPMDFKKVLAYGVGLTDIAKYRSGADIQLRRSDFDVQSFRAKIERFVPRAVAFNGKRSAEAFYEIDGRYLCYGRQPNDLGQSAVWILPSTSGSARRYWDETWWENLAAFVSDFQAQVVCTDVCPSVIP